jgi:hypothetical protein
MKPLRAPWQVWADVALAPVLWFLYQAPGEPESGDPVRATAGSPCALLMVLWDRSSRRCSAGGYTGALGSIFTYPLFDPFEQPRLGCGADRACRGHAALFVLFIAPATIDWGGVKDRRASTAPADPTT